MPVFRPSFSKSNKVTDSPVPANDLGSSSDIERPRAPRLEAKRFSVDGVPKHLQEPGILFYDIETQKDYKIYQKLSLNWITLIPLLLVCVVFMAARFNFQNAFIDGPYFSAAIVFWLLAAVLFVLFVMVEVIVYCVKDEKIRFLDAAKSMQALFGGRPEDLIGILAHLSFGMYLFARIIKGQCPENSSLWETQRCNPAADAGFVPLDMMIFIYLTPLVCQIGLKTFSIQAILACWAISYAYSIASIIYVPSGRENQVWTIIVGLIIPFISFEYEKTLRTNFLRERHERVLVGEDSIRVVNRQQMNKALMLEQQKNKRLLADEENNRLLLVQKANHELDIAVLHAAEAKKIMEIG
jgi:hypothetical protein